MEQNQSLVSGSIFSPSDVLRSEAQKRDLREVLQSGTEVLIGVGTDQAQALTKLGIESVFDLATSQVFADATELADAGKNEANLYRRSGMVKSGLLSGEQKVPIEELRHADIGVLADVGPALAPVLRTALQVETVEELAKLPAYRAAKGILATVFFPQGLPGYDPEAPADLLPRNGDFPTERVSYTTLLLDALPGKPPQIDALGDDFEPLDIAAATKGDWGFKQIAFGTMLTYQQSWYQEGVTLGQLLHSTALAPGESTRMAVVDWSRRSRAGETATERQSESLTNDTEQKRAINEVTSAVASEAQGGFAGSSQSSKTTQHSVTTAGPQGDGSGGLGSAVGGVLDGAIGAIGSVAEEIFDLF